jgi:hypothetical protein
VPEAERPVVVEAVGIGATVHERCGHRGQRGARPWIIAQVTGDAAHGVVALASSEARRERCGDGMACEL